MAEEQAADGGQDASLVAGFGDTTAEHERTVTFAVLDIPSGAIRRYLIAGRPPSLSLEKPILAAARAALAPS